MSRSTRASTLIIGGSVVETGAGPWLQPVPNGNTCRVQAGLHLPRGAIEAPGDASSALAVDIRAPQDFGLVARQGGNESADATSDKLF